MITGWTQRAVHRLHDFTQSYVFVERSDLRDILGQVTPLRPELTRILKFISDFLKETLNNVETCLCQML
jgi:hypothetical protein